MEPSWAGLKVLREVAERGSFTAAAAELGFTQSAVSRQAAALEREAGARLFERGRGGVRLTPAGRVLLRHARAVLDEVAAAERTLDGVEPDRRPVRLGAYVSAGATLLPTALTILRRHHPEVAVRTREGTTPALVRALRAGTLDLAVITSRPPHRPPDTESPPLVVETLAESALLVAAPDDGRFGGRGSVTLDELADADWIASPSTGAETLLGVWPGLAGRPRVAHQARDWLSKLALVAAGAGLTTVPANLVPALPDGVRALRVADGPVERRRQLVARRPGPVPSAVATVVRVLEEMHASPRP